MHAHFRMMARYTDWANRRLFAAVAALPEADYRRDGGVFFGSLHGTLNHILVADRIWLRRMTGEGEAPTALDAILYDDLPALRAAREAEDARILAYVDGLDDAALAGPLRYRALGRTAEMSQPLATVLAHLFNHHTHHRGQAHGLLTRWCGEAPSLDLIYYQRETGLTAMG